MSFYRRIRWRLARNLNNYLLNPMVIRDWHKPDDFDVVNKAIAAGYFREWLIPKSPSLTGLKKVLVLAPHPDDEAIGCGGLMLKLKKLDAQMNVTILFITNGEQGNTEQKRRNSASKRLKEANEVAQRFKAEYHFLGISNLYLDVNDKNCIALCQFLDSLKPQIVLTPWLFDTPYKHRLTALMLHEALIKYRGPKVQIWGYQVHNIPFPNLYVDISDEINEKVAIISLYKSQIENVAPYDHYSLGMAIWAAKQTMDSNIRYAEIFYAIDQGVYQKLFKKLIKPNLQSYLKGMRRKENITVSEQ